MLQGEPTAIHEYKNKTVDEIGRDIKGMLDKFKQRLAPNSSYGERKKAEVIDIEPKDENNKVQE